MIFFFLFLLNILICLLIASLGRNRKFGFWGYFFASLLLTPFLGMILVIASSPVQPKDRESANQ